MNNNQEFSITSRCEQNEDESGGRYENQDNKLSDVEKSNEEFTIANISPSNSSATPCSSIPMIHSTSERSIDPHEQMVISITGKPSSQRKSKDKSIKFPAKVRRRHVVSSSFVTEYFLNVLLTLNKSCSADVSS